ncbi:MAG: hypothetical protein HQK53_13975 [Oligoflexia bacterium]|nr:hypothetical protein [Oligoflexia bacterium]
MNFNGAEYLINKDPTIHQKPEVRYTRVQRTLAGEKNRGKSSDQVQDWLEVLEQTHVKRASEDQAVKEKIKTYYHKQYIWPYKEDITRGAAKVEARAAREMGFGDIAYEGEALRQRQEIAVVDLEKSLDSWINYLTSKNEQYPIWFRYYVFTNIVKLGSYDIDKQEFRKRTKDTFFPFPDIDRGALAEVQTQIEKGGPFANKSFAEQYAYAIKTNGEITPELRAETRGEWRKYDQGTKPDELWESLQNKGVPWCTRGYATAEKQLKEGDFYVYYTLDKLGQPTIPRVAIRMDGDYIGEVRGVADNSQNLEANMTDIAREKYNDLPGAEHYEKADADMKQLGVIEKKNRENKELTREELKFLYEVERDILGFGYESDPRIKKIKSTRDIRLDLSIVYEVSQSQIALELDEINGETIISLDDHLLNVEYLIKNDITNLKIINGGLYQHNESGDRRISLSSESASVLRNLERIGNQDVVNASIDHLGSYSVERLSPERYQDRCSGFIDISLNYIANKKSHDSLTGFTHFLTATEPEENRFRVFNTLWDVMSPDQKKELYDLVEEFGDSENYKYLLGNVLYRPNISTEDINFTTSSIDRLPQDKQEEIISQWFRYDDQEILVNINLHPEIIEFLAEKNIPLVNRYFEKYRTKLTGQALSVYIGGDENY